MKKFNPESKHVTLDFYSCKIPSEERIKKIFLKASAAAGAHVLDISMRKFPSGGYTGVVLLAESHITIHTWPEYSYVAIDIFMCGEDKSLLASEYIKKKLEYEKVVERVLLRGNSFT